MDGQPDHQRWHRLACILLVHACLHLALAAPGKAPEAHTGADWPSCSDTSRPLPAFTRLWAAKAVLGAAQHAQGSPLRLQLQLRVLLCLALHTAGLQCTSASLLQSFCLHYGNP